MVKEDIIIKGLFPFFKDKRNRSEVNGSCMYNSPTGKHCFAGQFLKPKHKKQGLNFGSNSEPYNISIKDCFYKYFNSLGEKLISELQQFHDIPHYWRSREKTWKQLKSICRKYDLDFEYIKLQLIEKCKKN